MSPGKPLEHALLRMAGAIDLLPLRGTPAEGVTRMASQILLAHIEGWFYNDGSPLGGRCFIGSFRGSIVTLLEQQGDKHVPW
jgi:hypothetical protein